MLCLVFTGNEFKTRLDVKLMHCCLYIHVSLIPYYIHIGQWHVVMHCYLHIYLQLIWCRLAWITDTKPAAYCVLMSCKSSLCLDSCQVCRQQGFLCFLISGFLAFGNMSHFVTMLTTVWDMRLILSVSVKLQLKQSVDKSAAMKTIRYVRCCFNACSKVSLIYCAEPTTTHTPI